MKQIIPLFLLIIFLTSCSCLKKNVENNGIILTESNLTLLNGKYERKSTQTLTDSISVGDLYSNFYANSYIFGEAKGLNHKSDTDFFELKVINKNKILVSYIDGNDTIRSEIVKGKIRNGYFELKRKYLFLPIILANVYSDSKFRIKPSHSGDLITDYKRIDFGTFYFVIPFYFKEEKYNTIFKRIEDTIE